MHRGYKLMGLMPNFLMKRPHVAEHDFTGIIADANGTEFTPGEAVWGFIPVGTFPRVPVAHAPSHAPQA